MDNIGAFYRWRQSQELCDYIHDQASRHCGKDPALFEDLRQEAWLYITLVPPDSDIPTLKRAAYNAIRNVYRYTRKHRHLAFETYFNAANHRIY